MARSEALITATVICLVASLVQVDALKCWECSSTTTQEFCNDPFNADKINATMRSQHFHDCHEDNDPNYRNICRKLVRKGNDGKVNIERNCFQEKTYGTRTQRDCEYGPGDNNAASDPNTIFCNTCTSDGCNGASSFTPFVSVIMVPAALAKLFLYKS